MKDNSKPLVSIRCTVYNHEPFLRQCLDGFVMQKTNFSFEAIVHDDASTDRSAEIIREYAEKYPDIIKPIYETENQYSKKDGSLGKIMDNAIHPDAKYIAYCEGDDYWTDPLKLQKQVDFMESHAKCVLTYHACKNEFENVYNISPIGETVRESYDYKTIFESYFQTATVLVKKDVLFSSLYEKARKIRSLDIILYLVASQQGEIMGTNEKMSVYRRHPGGISLELCKEKYIFDDFKVWIKLSKLFDKPIRRFLEEEEIKRKIFMRVYMKQYFLLVKMVSYGIIFSPLSVVSAIKYIFSFYYKKIKRIINNQGC